MRRRLLALGALFVVGCSTANDCTLVGCGTGVTVSPPPGVAEVSAGVLTICADDDCTDTRFENDDPAITASLAIEDLDDDDDVTATLVLPDGSRFEAEGKPRRLQPNGSGCDPTCFRAELVLVAT